MQRHHILNGKGKAIAFSPRKITEQLIPAFSVISARGQVQGHWLLKLTALVIFLNTSSPNAVAQITADDTLGIESSIVNPATINGIPSTEISGGASRGANLFHSFLDFNIPQGQGAYFINPAGIDNILSRVTGNTPSHLQGTLGVLGNANLFLINPNGIIFGQQARLDVGGSFMATTANAVGFGDLGVFSASNPEPPSTLLTVNPSAFLFNQLVPQPRNSIKVDGSGLSVPNGESLVLLGGVSSTTTSTPAILMDGGALLAPGGQVELGAVSAPGTVGLHTLDVNGSHWRLSFPEDITRTDITLTDGAYIGVIDADGGGIAINARNFTLSDESKLIAGIGNGLGNVDAQAGDIDINATETVTIIDKSEIFNGISSGARGNGGDINIATGSLLINERSGLGAMVWGQGNGGNITINALDTVSIQGEGGASAIVMDVPTAGQGNSGTITINTQVLSVTGEAGITTSTVGNGNAGNIIINAGNSIYLDGEGASGNTRAIATRVRTRRNRNGEVTGAIGNGGNITITTGTLTMVNRARIDARTAGQGNAGNIQVIATDAVNISGTEPTGPTSAGGLTTDTSFVRGRDGNSITGRGGNITVRTEAFRLFDHAVLSASTAGNEASGSIEVTANTVEVINGGRILATSAVNSSLLRPGETISGAAGNITLIATDNVTLSGINSEILTSTNVNSTGNGGDINVQTSRLSLTDGAQLGSSTAGRGAAGQIDVGVDALSITNGAKLDASTFGQGDAGNIAVQAANSVLLANDGAIFGRVAEGANGNGGDINLQTRSLFATEGGRVETRTLGLDSGANAGTITINADAIHLAGISPTQGVSSGLLSGTQGQLSGQGGNINVRTNSLYVADGAVLSARTLNQSSGGNVTVNANTVEATGGGQLLTTTTSGGRAGNITVNAIEQVTLIGGDPTLARYGVQALDPNSTASGFFASTSAAGAAGNLAINTQHLRVQEGAQISASTSSEGEAGNIHINASDAVNVLGINLLGVESRISTSTSGSGNGGNIAVTTHALQVAQGGVLDARTTADGEGGSIYVEANTLDVTSGGRLLTTTEGSQSAGDITLTLDDRINLTGSGTGVLANTAPNSTGSGGSITLTTGELVVNDEAQVAVSSQGLGNAGNLDISVENLLLDNQGKLTAETESGNGGNITLRVQDLLLLRRNSQISTTAGNAQAGGDGGNMIIDAGFIVAVSGENSDITANAFQGRGGNINITTQGIYGSEFRDRLTPESDITASSRFGVNGNVTITTPGIDPSRGLTALATELVDASGLISQSCSPSDGQQQGEFVVTGRGGLPSSPSQFLSHDTVWSDWRVPVDRGTPGDTGNSSVFSSPSPSPIVEAQGWMINQQGQVVLTTAAPTVTPHQSEQMLAAKCHVSQ